MFITTTVWICYNLSRTPVVDDIGKVSLSLLSYSSFIQYYHLTDRFAAVFMSNLSS